MMTQPIDTIGTLQLEDTGRRCAKRKVRVLRVCCTKNCGTNVLVPEANKIPYWEALKQIGGLHAACTPTDSVGAKLRHDARRSILDKRPPGACPACDRLDCTGAGA